MRVRTAICNTLPVLCTVRINENAYGFICCTITLHVWTASACMGLHIGPTRTVEGGVEQSANRRRKSRAAIDVGSNMLLTSWLN